MKKKAIVIALLLTATLSGCTSEASVTQNVDTSVPVHAQQIERTTIKNELSYAGQIKPKESISVISALAGKVESLYFDIGDSVNQDDVLFRLDKKNIEDQIKQLNAQLNLSNTGIRSAETGLANVTGGQMQSQIAQLESAIEAQRKQLDNAGIQLQNARSALESAQTSYNNVQILYESGVATRNQFDDVDLLLQQRTAGVEQAEIAQDAALVSLQQSENSLRILTEQIIGENEHAAQLGIDQAVASRQSVQVQLDIASSALNDADVKSPITGVISGRNVRVGEMISQAVPAYTIVNVDTVNVDVRISELLINRIWLGQEVSVYIHSLGEEPLQGIIKTISPVADATSTFPIQIEIDNADGLIRPGMFAEVRLVRDESQNTFVVDRNVVLSDESSSFVFVAENGFAKRVNVRTGIDNGKQIEIVEGISATDDVIIRGQNYVKDGETISVISQ